MQDLVCVWKFYGCSWTDFTRTYFKDLFILKVRITEMLSFSDSLPGWPPQPVAGQPEARCLEFPLGLPWKSSMARSQALRPSSIAFPRSLAGSWEVGRNRWTGGTQTTTYQGCRHCRWCYLQCPNTRLWHLLWKLRGLSAEITMGCYSTTELASHWHRHHSLLMERYKEENKV